MIKLSNPNVIKRIQNNYRVVVSNDDTFEEIIAFKLNRVLLYTGISFIFILLVGLTVSLLVFTPLKYYIPGYGNLDSKTELQLLKIRTDLLEKSMQQKQRYIDDIKKAIAGTTDVTNRNEKPLEISQSSSSTSDNNESKKERKRKRRRR